RSARVSWRPAGIRARVAPGEMENDIPDVGAGRSYPRRFVAAAGVDSSGWADFPVGRGRADAGYRLGLPAGRPEAHGLTLRLVALNDEPRPHRLHNVWRDRRSRNRRLLAWRSSPGIGGRGDPRSGGSPSGRTSR